jgi:hypothetical protein
MDQIYDVINEIQLMLNSTHIKLDHDLSYGYLINDMEYIKNEQQYL